MTTRDRRREILDAALRCFLAKGYAAASIADIREASGATTGSIYHAFAGKAAIATALFLEAVEGWSRATARAQRGEGAEARIRASVEGLIAWGSEHPDLFRFMDEMRFLEALTRRESTVAGALDQTHSAARDLYDTDIRHGRLKAMPWPLARALILGPAYEYLRALAASGAPMAAPDAVRVLSDAAWKAVRA